MSERNRLAEEYATRFRDRTDLKPGEVAAESFRRGFEACKIKVLGLLGEDEAAKLLRRINEAGS